MDENLIHIIALKDNRIYDLMKENKRLKKQNQDLIYENTKMVNYIKNYGVTHGEIKKEQLNNSYSDAYGINK